MQWPETLEGWLSLLEVRHDQAIQGNKSRGKAL